VVEEVLAMVRYPGCTTGPMATQLILATRINDQLYQVLEERAGDFKVVLPGPRPKA
jgi:hypothetical protein